MLSPVVLILSQLLASAGASLVNVTIDDTRGDQRSGRVPQYASVHAWNAGSAGTQCSVCGARPDGTKAFDKTWHDDTTFPDQLPSNVTFTFNGSIVYVFFMLANNIDVVHKDTRLAFYLDGSSTPVSQFLHEPDLTSDGFIYNQLVFKSAPLSDGQHSLLISSWADGDSGSIALFDYAIYSATDDGSPTVPGTSPLPSNPTSSLDPSSSIVSGQAHATSSPINPLHPSSSARSGQSSAPTSNVGAAVGGSVAGAALAIALLGFLAWYCIRRRRRIRHSPPPPEMITAFRAPVTDYWATESEPHYGHRGKGAPAGIQTLSSPTSSRLTFSTTQFPSPHPGHISSWTATTETAESARLRSELERTRDELERVRQFAEPLPEYS